MPPQLGADYVFIRLVRINYYLLGRSTFPTLCIPARSCYSPRALAADVIHSLATLAIQYKKGGAKVPLCLTLGTQQARAFILLRPLLGVPLSTHG